MSQFKKNAATVVSFLKERGYSKQTICNYEKTYLTIEDYLEQKEVIYSPETGESMLHNGDNSFFGAKNVFLWAASIAKINAVYRTGCV